MVDSYEDEALVVPNSACVVCGTATATEGRLCDICEPGADCCEVCGMEIDSKRQIERPGTGIWRGCEQEYSA